MKTTLIAMIAAALLLTGCGGSDTGTESSTPTPDSSEQAGDVVVDIAIENGRVSPHGDRVGVKVGQPVTLRISSDVQETIHVHSEPEHEWEVHEGDEIEETFTVDKPGQVAVEAHHLDSTIVQLVVRP